MKAVLFVAGFRKKRKRPSDLLLSAGEGKGSPNKDRKLRSNMREKKKNTLPGRESIYSIIFVVLLGENWGDRRALLKEKRNPSLGPVNLTVTAFLKDRFKGRRRSPF